MNGRLLTALVAVTVVCLSAQATTDETIVAAHGGGGESACIAEGGVWLNGGCDFPPPEEEEEEEEADEDNEKTRAAQCAERGGTWRIGYCDEPMDLGLTANCDCFFDGRWESMGETTYPHCMVIAAQEIQHDPGAVCQWPAR